MSDDWTPVHHEDAPDPPKQKPKPKEKAGDKSGEKGDKENEGKSALVLTFPPHMITGIWSLTEALKENTEALNEHTKALRALDDSKINGLDRSR